MRQTIKSKLYSQAKPKNKTDDAWVQELNECILKVRSMLRHPHINCCSISRPCRLHPPSFLFCQIAGLDEKLGGHHLDDDDDDEVDPGVDESAPTPKVAGKKLPGGCKASRDRMRAGCD